MADNRNYAALDWVVGEIGETLKQARQALEAYVENPQDSTRIRFCLTHIHQVHGSLHMLEFSGAALLAEEMEALAQALMSGETASDLEAHEVLMRAILQLPIYLEQVKVSRSDDPVSLLPLLNDLRAVRGSSLLSGDNYFKPNIEAAHDSSAQKNPALSNPVQYQAILEKLRKMYQYAAAGVIRGVNVEENLLYLDKVFARLHKLTEGTTRAPLWELALGLSEALQAEQLQICVAVKSLLRELDQEIKFLAEHSVEAFNSYSSDQLLKNLLYYIARSSSHSERIESLRRQYDLAQALDGEGHSGAEDLLAGPDPETIRSVVHALNDELESVKHALDMSISGHDEAAVIEALPVMQRVADTLSVLGTVDLRAQLLKQIDALQAASAEGTPSSELLMSVANDIINMEQRLATMAQGGSADTELEQVSSIELNQAQESVLREARNGLEQAKDAIIEYIASQWDTSHLSNVPGLLAEIRGGLAMVPLARPAMILQSCGAYIEEQLLEGLGAPDWQQLDTLADAIASVEYYLERLSGDRDEDDALLLGVAEESVAQLGYPIVGAVATEPVASNADLGSVLEKIAEVETLDLDSLPPVVEAPVVETSIVETPVVEASVAEASEAESTRVEVEAEVELAPVLESAAGTEDETLAEPDLATEERLGEGELDTATALEPVPATGEQQEDDEEELDDEILEIFVEESAEVLEAIDEFFPLWANDFTDKESLKEFRRAFHTLKGSGRMVGAHDIGELAWSIESLLNSILDGGVQSHPAQVNLIGKVRALLPEFIQAFEHKQPNPNPQLAAQYMAWANALCDGELPTELLESIELPGTEETPAQAPASGSLEPLSDTSDEDDDAILWDIFGSEALGHLGVVEAFIAQMVEAAPLYTPPSESMQRALHTLKGSAHMAEVHDVAELATPLERFAKELRTYQVNIDDDILQLMRDGVSYTQQALAQIRDGEPVAITKLPQYLARVAELRDLSVGALIHQQENEHSGGKKIDPELLSIFMAEEMNLLLDADELLSSWKAQLPAIEDHGQLKPLTRELDTLATGAERACLPTMAELSCNLYRVYLAAENRAEPLQGLLASDYDTLLMAHEQLLDMVDAVAAGQNLKPIEPQVLAALAELQARLSVPQSQDEQAADLQETGELDQQSAEAEPLPLLDDAPQANSETPQPIHEAESDGPEFKDTEFEGTEFEDTELEDLALEDVSEEALVLKAAELGAEPAAPEPLSEIEADDSSAAAIEAIQSEELPLEDALLEKDPVEEPQVEEPSEALIDTSEGTQDSAADALRRDLGDDFDEEILAIFLEEADEIHEEMEHAVHAWEGDWDQTHSSDELKRCLHTLKGGARLSGLMGIGELAHDLETYLIDLGEHPQLSDTVFGVIHQYQDKILRATEGVKSVLAGGEADLTGVINIVKEGAEVQPLSADQAGAVTLDEPLTPVEDLAADDEAALTDRLDEVLGDSAAAESEPAYGADILPFTPKSESAGELQEVLAPIVESGVSVPQGSGGAAAAPLQAKRQAPQEVIKVSAELMEELVNLAGETSIGRGRMEEQVSEMGFTIEEMDATIHRLQDQLRRLDIETEAQVLFRQEQLAEQEDFDPLEMDRYSQLQQLSRSLLESASDLMDLKGTLTDKTRDAETLLLQQARINTDLQEGLMRSRMVPFSRLVPRLRRIVRQVSSELGKQVNFELDNVEGELDRTVLERMIAPLEHMLRNAVDHGIENPAERHSSGKPETGRVTLSLAREGGDVMLRLSDDGRGINLPRVREKAIERGLMTADANLSDRDVMQFILHAGFSTADSVTQISGRGVGMDVVNSEIKQLGGAMSINSQTGAGSEFTVRLPFTVSVNRALMIRLGDDRYAIPLNNIEGIVRVSPFELEHYYQDPEARFEYAGENYQVRYLGNMLSNDTHPKLEGTVMPLPVVLVRTAQHAVAMQVDMLMGSREIVVKSLGQQFSSVQGVSGATVMGDGSVVVILDPHAMIRRDAALAHMPNQLLDQAAVKDSSTEQSKTIMVVDDSVTVRKVTTRFLEREGYTVLTAKDGADALLKLQDHIPDAMLLDIEMPRMDGFEVAKNVRSSSRLKDIPIIMITSRTGDKHREHAASLGVNEYMGKPFQEDQLLHNIRLVTGEQVDAEGPEE